jgi:hypothetical protein
MGLKPQVFMTTLGFLTQTIFLNISLEIIHFKMMTMMTFLAVYLVKGLKMEIPKAQAIADLALEEDLVQVSLNQNHYFKMMIFSQGLREVIFLHLDRLHLEIKA